MSRPAGCEARCERETRRSWLRFRSAWSREAEPAAVRMGICVAGTACIGEACRTEGIFRYSAAGIGKIARSAGQHLWPSSPPNSRISGDRVDKGRFGRRGATRFGKTRASIASNAVAPGRDTPDIRPRWSNLASSLSGHLCFPRRLATNSLDRDWGCAVWNGPGRWRESHGAAASRLNGQPRERRLSAATSGGTQDRLPPARGADLARGIVTRI
jgi:hypothetical protein